MYGKEEGWRLLPPCLFSLTPFPSLCLQLSNYWSALWQSIHEMAFVILPRFSWMEWCQAAGFLYAPTCCLSSGISPLWADSCMWSERGFDFFEHLCAPLQTIHKKEAKGGNADSGDEDMVCMWRWIFCFKTSCVTVYRAYCFISCQLWFFGYSYGLQCRI